MGTAPFTVVANLGCSDVENGTALTFYLRQTPGTHFTAAFNSVQLIEGIWFSSDK